MTAVVAYLLLVVVVPAWLLGHQAQDFPPLQWWRTLKAWQAREAACTPVSRPHSPSRPPLSVRGAPEAPQRRSRPSWAHTQPINEEAA